MHLSFRFLNPRTKQLESCCLSGGFPISLHPEKIKKKVYVSEYFQTLISNLVIYLFLFKQIFQSIHNNYFGILECGIFKRFGEHIKSEIQVSNIREGVKNCE